MLLEAEPPPDEELELELDVVVQVGLVIMLWSSVTAAVRDMALPFRVALVFNTTDVPAMIDPMKVELDPRVAWDDTTQNTLHACALFIRDTTLLDAVTKLDEA